MKKIFAAISDYWNSYSFYQKALFMLIWSIGLHLPIALGNFILHDEQYTILLTQQPFFQMMSTIIREDGHPPLSYIFFRMFSFGDLETTMRLMRVAGMIAFLGGSFLLGCFPVRRLVGDKVALWFVFFILFMPVSFYFTTNIRMYPLACLFLTGAFIYAQNIVWNYRKSDWLYLTIFSVLGLYTHYYCALTLALIWSILLWDICRQKQYQQIKNIFIYGALTAICFLPWMYVFVLQYFEMKSTWFPNLLNAQWSIGGFFDAYMHYPDLLDLIFGIITIFAVIKMCFYNNSEIKTKVMVRRVVTVYFGLYALAWGISVLVRPMLVAHYLSVVKGIFIIALACAVVHFHRIRKVVSGLMLLMILSSYIFYYGYTHLRIQNQMQHIIRTHVPENSLMLYEETVPHLFLRTYFPNMPMYYAPLSPEVVLLQDEVQQESEWLQHLEDFGHKVYYIKKCQSDAGLPKKSYVAKVPWLTLPFCIYRLEKADIERLVKNADQYHQRLDE